MPIPPFSELLLEQLVSQVHADLKRYDFLFDFVLYSLLVCENESAVLYFVAD